LEVKKETSKIVLNSHQLEINDVVLSCSALQGGQAVKAETVELVEKAERATATFPNAIPLNSKAQLGLRFSGKLQGNMVGVRSRCYMNEACLRADSQVFSIIAADTKLAVQQSTTL
jgi:aminopeptidase 2